MRYGRRVHAVAHEVNPAMHPNRLRVFLLFLLVLPLLLGLLALLSGAGSDPVRAQGITAVELTATPSATPTLTGTLTITPTATITPTLTGTVTPPPAGLLYLPVISGSPERFLAVPERVSGTPPIDFAAARTAAQTQGLDLAFNKIGFHVGIGGNRTGLRESLIALDAAGVEFFLKTANDAQPIFEAQELAKASGMDHTLVYRDAATRIGGVNIDIPNYNLPPAQAALLNWQANRLAFPPELDPAFVWMETINEPDGTKAAWLGAFALEQAQLAVAEGVRYAAFGWANGQPEPEDWETPEMLAFLRFAADHPQQIAVALHEYSFSTDEIGLAYPFFIGRFQRLFDICDKHGIPRPAVLITEWGWEYDDVARPPEALEDIAWASWLYAAYPEVKGAAIWYLGQGDQFGSIADRAQKLIAPVTEYSLSNYFLYQPGSRPIDAELFRPVPPTGARR